MLLLLLQVRIDHSSRTLSFGSDLNYSTKEDSPVGPFLQNMPSEQIRNQLTAMSASLAKAIQIIKPTTILVSPPSSLTDDWPVQSSVTFAGMFLALLRISCQSHRNNEISQVSTFKASLGGNEL